MKRDNSTGGFVVFLGGSAFPPFLVPPQEPAAKRMPRRQQQHQQEPVEVQVQRLLLELEEPTNF